MVLVDCDKFSANDLDLFVDCLEQISRIESSKRQREQEIRDQNMADTSRSSTFASKDKPDCESTAEAKSIIGNSTSCIMEEQYYMDPADVCNEDQDDSLACHNNRYSMPVDCRAATNLDTCHYDTLKSFDHYYEEVGHKKVKRTNAKRKLPFLSMIRKKYKKYFSSNTTNYWEKSDSWIKISGAGAEHT